MECENLTFRRLLDKVWRHSGKGGRFGGVCKCLDHEELLAGEDPGNLGKGQLNCLGGTVVNFEAKPGLWSFRNAACATLVRNPVELIQGEDLEKGLNPLDKYRYFPEVYYAQAGYPNPPPESPRVTTHIRFRNRSDSDFRVMRIDNKTKALIREGIPVLSNPVVVDAASESYDIWIGYDYTRSHYHPFLTTHEAVVFAYIVPYLPQRGKMIDIFIDKAFNVHVTLPNYEWGEDYPSAEYGGYCRCRSGAIFAVSAKPGPLKECFETPQRFFTKNYNCHGGEIISGCMTSHKDLWFNQEVDCDTSKDYIIEYGFEEPLWMKGASNNNGILVGNIVRKKNDYNLFGFMTTCGYQERFQFKDWRKAIPFDDIDSKYVTFDWSQDFEVLKGKNPIIGTIDRQQKVKFVMKNPKNSDAGEAFEGKMVILQFLVPGYSNKYESKICVKGKVPIFFEYCLADDYKMWTFIVHEYEPGLTIMSKIWLKWLEVQE